MKHCFGYYANTVYVVGILMNRQVVHKGTAFPGEIKNPLKVTCKEVAA